MTEETMSSQRALAIIRRAVGDHQAGSMLAESLDHVAEKLAPQAAETCQILLAGEVQVISDLIHLAYRADNLTDNSEDLGAFDGRERGHTADRADFVNLSDAIERLETLPDDQPGFVMGPAAKAGWALRRILPQVTA